RAGDRRSRHRGAHPRPAHAPLLRRGAADRGDEGRPGARAPAHARRRGRRIADQGVRARPHDLPDGAGGNAGPARSGRLCGRPDAGAARGGARPGGSAAHLAMFHILLQEFIGDLKTQRTRAFLTFFAVTWGTLAVVLLLAFGEGLKRTVRDGLLGAGERIFMVYGGETSKSFAGLGQGRRIRLVEEDLDLIRSAISDVDRGSVSYGRWGTSFQMGKTRTNAFLE